jgi:hypothetical protein
MTNIEKIYLKNKVEIEKLLALIISMNDDATETPMWCDVAGQHLIIKQLTEVLETC